MTNPFQIAHGSALFAKHLVNQIIAGEDAALVLWERGSSGVLTIIKTLTTGWHKIDNTNPLVNWNLAFQLDARLVSEVERIRIHSVSNRGLRHVVNDKKHAEGTRGYHFLTVESSEQLPPRITTLSPATKAAGQPTFTLTVNGSNFRSDSVVRWNGADLVTTYVSEAQLTASVADTLIAAPATRPVTVYQAPNPYGGGTSAPVNFVIT